MIIIIDIIRMLLRLIDTFPAINVISETAIPAFQGFRNLHNGLLSHAVR